MSPMNLLPKRRVAAAGDKSPSSMSAFALTGKVGNAVRSIVGLSERRRPELTETRQDLQAQLSNIALSDDDDDWRNDFLSPKSAMSKDHDDSTKEQSSPSRVSDIAYVAESLTSSEGSSERPLLHDQVLFEPFKDSARSSELSTSSNSSERSSDKSSRHIRTSSYDAAFVSKQGHRSSHIVENDTSRSHRRSSTSSMITMPAPSVGRSASVASGPTQRRPRSKSASLESLVATLRMREQQLGPCDFKVGQTWNMIGNWHFRHQDYQEAISAYEQALKCDAGYERPADSDHIIAAYGNIGTACWSMGQLKRSILCFQKALDLRMDSESAQGKNLDESVLVANCHHQLGMALSLHHDYEMAMNALNTALRIRRKVLGRKHVDVARTLDAIGKVYLFKGDADKAITCHQQAYAIKHELTGENDITSLRNIAAAQVAREDYKKAIFAYLAVRNVQSSELEKAGKRNQNTSRLAMELGETCQMLVDLFTKTGSYHNAETAVDEALGFYLQAGLRSDHPDLQVLKHSLKVLESARVAQSAG